MVLNAMNQFSFYRLPPKQQRDYCHLLNCIQNGSGIKMGPFSELDYFKATQVTNFKYSINSKSILKQFFSVYQNDLLVFDDNAGASHLNV